MTFKTASSVLNAALYGALGATVNHLGLTGWQAVGVIGITMLIHINAKVGSILK